MRVDPLSTDLLGAPDRAGNVVREQIAAMIESARAAAEGIEREARSAGEAEWREAQSLAESVVGGIQSLERELTNLQRVLSRESDGLRAKVDRARLRSVAADTAAPGVPELDRTAGDAAARNTLTAGPKATGETAVGATPGPAAPEPARPEPEPGPDALAGEGEGEPEAVEEPGETELAQPADRESKAPEPPAETAGDTAASGASTEGGEAPPEPHGDLALALSGTATPGGALDEDARSRVAAKSDLELAELHQIATQRAAKGGEEEVGYWSALAGATVKEAASRPEFGASPPDPESGGRRAKKRRAKLLKPLMSARDEALAASPEPDEGGR